MMTDYVHNTFSWLEKNRYTALAAVIACSSVFLASCTFTAKDPLTGSKVTKDELVANLDATAKTSVAKYKQLEANFQVELAGLQEADVRIIAQYEAAILDIDRQRETWTSVISWVQQIPAVGANPLLGGALGLAGAVFGLGVGVDNKRKDKVIKDLKPRSSGGVPAVKSA